MLLNFILLARLRFFVSTANTSSEALNATKKTCVDHSNLDPHQLLTLPQVGRMWN
jgi:hypothetical protein